MPIGTAGCPTCCLPPPVQQRPDGSAKKASSPGSAQNYADPVAEDWDVSDGEMDAWLEEWVAVDRAADDYLADRVIGVREVLADDDARWVASLAETISPSAEPGELEVDAVSAVMALQHADWLGLVLGAVRRGPGAVLGADSVQADIDALEEIEGEIEDPEGHLAVIDMALIHLSPQWQDLGVLDDAGRFTARGVWGLPRALHRTWRG